MLQISMTALVPLLLKGLVAGVIVGAVTASIRSWVDRFFLVILLVSIVGLPIQQAITVNLVVVSVAALMMALRQTDVLTAVREDWAMIIISTGLGGLLGRLLGLSLPSRLLLALLGGYAILVGIRLLFVKPVPERETPAHPAWMAPIAFAGGILTGLLSAGGKPFTVPLYNWALGHHPKKAYALGSLGVVTGAWAALGTQIAVGRALKPSEMALAAYEFIIISLTALVVGRYWSPKVNRWVSLIVAPLLILVGVRFFMMLR
jgi:uncharacterized membrane protein YfcA